MIPAAVLVVLNGAIVAGAPPARLLFGHVVAPLAPLVTQIADRVQLDGDAIAIERGGVRCVLRIGSRAMRCNGAARTLPVAPFGRDGVAYVPLAEVASAFGAAIAYDPASHVLALDMPVATAVTSPQPFDPSAPQASPTVIFTPSPPAATRPPLLTGSPQPRRTAIPAVPSRGG